MSKTSKILKRKHIRRSTKSSLSHSCRKVGSKQNRLWKELTITGAIVLMLFFLASLTLFSVPKMEGYGMTPTVNDKERVFVNRLGKIKRFRLVYFKVPERNEYSIRRVIGLPGETIQYKNDQLLVNEQEKVERFLLKRLQKAKQNEELMTDDFSLNKLPNFSKTCIPSDYYLVLGDNRPYSSDSRYYGLVKKDAIVGIVEERIWPLSKLTHY